MADMDKLMEFLWKETPSNAGDLNDAINNLFEIIEHTRTALKSKLSTMANNFFEDSNYNEIIKEFQNANKQLENFKSNLSNFVNDNKNINSNIGMLEDVLIEENDTEDIAEDEKEEIEEREGKIDYKKYLVDNTKPYPLSSDFENTTPYSFSFRGEVHKVKTYKDMWLKLCEILYGKDKNTFKEIATWHQIRGRKKPYIVYESDKAAKSITNPLRFLNTKIILEGTTSTTQKIKIISKMLEIYKINPSSVKVYLKSDRHPRHGQEPIGIYKDKSYDYNAEIASNLKINEVLVNNSDISIGKLAYDYFQNYFNNTTISYDIKNFLNDEWCKDTFNISYPLLKEIDETRSLREQTIPVGKSHAYYAQKPKLHINNKLYIIYMPWNDKIHRSRLEKWISENPITNSIQETTQKTNVFILPKNKIKICFKCGNKTQMDKLLVTYYKENVDFSHTLNIRKCNNCSLIYMSEGTLKMYKDTSDKLDTSINFIEKDT